LHSFTSFAGLGFWPAGRLAGRLAATLAGCRLASAGASVAIAGSWLVASGRPASWPAGAWFLIGRVCGRPAGQLGLGLWSTGWPAGTWFVAGRPASWGLVCGRPAGRPAGAWFLASRPAGRPAGWLDVK